MTASKAKAWREWIAAVAIVLGGLFAVYRLWWEDLYRPRHADPVIDLSLDLSKGDPKPNGLIPLHVKVTAHNKSQTLAVTLHSLLTLKGHRVTAANATPPRPGTTPSGLRTELTVPAQPVLIASGVIWPELDWLEPDQTQVMTFVVHVPASAQIDSVTADAVFRTARDAKPFQTHWKFDPSDGWQPERYVDVGGKWERYDPEHKPTHFKIREKQAVRTFWAHTTIAL